MNLVILRGNLVRDPELKYLPSGTAVATFTVAVSEYYKKKDGEKEQRTEFINCEAWDSGAETINEIMHKGESILVQGSLKEDSWGEEGDKKYKTKIRVRTFEKLTPRNYNPSSETPEKSKAKKKTKKTK